LRWSTREKEAYAIYWSITQLLNYLEGRFFTLRTDHQNLLYISEIGSQKVNRWWYELQQLNFSKEHISGPNNYIADMLSRIPRANPCENQHELVSIMKENDHGMANSRIEHEKESNVEYLHVIIPKEDFNSRVANAFKWVHNSSNGHWGVDKTVQLMKEHQSTVNGQNILTLNPKTDYKHLRKQVEIMIKQCGICQKLSYIRPQIEARRFTVAHQGSPMEVISVDHITGLPIAETFGYECILVIICLFSRFVELYPVQSPNAEETARCLLQHFGRYGVPERMVSDNGSEFVNETIKHITKMIGTEHIKTLAYSKQENAVVERANKEVLRHLRAIIMERLLVEKWWIYLPLVQRTMNSSKHDRLGVSPAEIVFGDAARLQKGFVIPISSDERLDTNTLSVSEKHMLNGAEVWKPKDLSDSTVWTVQEYMSRLHFAQRRIIATARAEQIKIDREHMEEDQAKHLNRKVGEGEESLSQRQLTEFPLYSYVYAQYRNTGMGPRPPTKLHAFWRGPLQVIEHEGSVYTLRDLINNRLSKHHVKTLKVYEYDLSKPDEPRRVALMEHQSQDVKAILDHRYKGDKKKVTSYSFLVQFVDNDEHWIGWRELNKNEFVHRYLADNGMKNLVPRNYR